MKTLACILATVLVLFGLFAGGCALMLFAENIATGIQGLGFSLFIMGWVSLGLATALIAIAIWIVRIVTREPTESKPLNPRNDVHQP
ncbi:MAG: hypothetical protein RLZZ326_1881 [Planctomycetota bacterium]|jgi:membrane protein implicated in regulation of membrane protease activity